MKTKMILMGLLALSFSASYAAEKVSKVMKSDKHYWMSPELSFHLSKPEKNTKHTEADGSFGSEALRYSVASGNWNDPGVWDCNCIPTESDIVIVTGNDSIYLSQDLTVNRLILAEGGVLDLSTEDYELNVLASLTIRGTFKAHKSTLRFSGTTLGSTSGNYTVYNLVINKPKTKLSINSGEVRVIRLVTVEQGELDARNNLVLLSDENGTATLGQVNGVVSSPIRIQRYLNGMGKHIGYRHVTVPIQNGTIADLQLSDAQPEGIYLYGFEGANKPYAAGYQSTYGFKEELAAQYNVFDSGWVACHSTTDSLHYSSALTFYGGGSSFPVYKFDVSGIPNQGELKLEDMSYSNHGNPEMSGWHLIGNPYPASIDWASVTTQGIDATIYVFSETHGGYLASSLLEDPNKIASFQGFMVHANSSKNAITFKESNKLNKSTTLVRGTHDINRLRLSIAGTNRLVVPIALDIIEDATEGVDPAYDAYKMKNPNKFPSLYFEVNQSKLQVNAIPERGLRSAIPIYLEYDYADSLELWFQELPKLNGCIHLYDKVTKQSIPLDTNQSYRFWHDPTYAANRFEIVSYDYLASSKAIDFSCFEANDGEIRAEFVELKSSWSLIYKMKDTVSVGNQSSVREQNLSTGYYQLIWGEESTCGLHEKAYNINQPQAIQVAFDAPQFAEVNEVVDFFNNSRNEATYYWTVEGETYDSYDLLGYTMNNKGNVAVTLHANQGVCFDSLTQVVEVGSSAVGLKENSKDALDMWITDNNLRVYNPYMEKMEFYLFDMSGKEIEHQVLSSTKTETPIKAKLYSGIYILKYRTLNELIFESKKVLITD